MYPVWLALFAAVAAWSAPADVSALVERITTSDDPYVVLDVPRGAEEAAAKAAYQTIFRALQRTASSDPKARAALGRAKDAYAALRTEDPFKTFGTSSKTRLGNVQRELFEATTQGAPPAATGDLASIVSAVELAADPYQVLGVEPGVSESVARASFQKLFRVLQKGAADPRAAGALAKAKSAYMSLRSPDAAKSFEQLSVSETARASWRTTQTGRIAAMKPAERDQVLAFSNEDSFMLFLINSMKETPGSLNFELSALADEAVAVNKAKGVKLDLERVLRRILGEYVFFERTNPFEKGYLHTGAHVVLFAASRPSFETVWILNVVKANARILGLADGRFKPLVGLADQAIALVTAAEPRAKWANLLRPAAYCEALASRILKPVAPPNLNF